MKKFLNKIKTSITALGIAVVSLFSKVIGQFIQETQYLYGVPNIQDVYGVPPIEQKINIIIKIAQRALVGVVFIIGIVNLIKIKKTDDKVQRKKRIRRFIIIISILVVILIAAFLVPTLLINK